jgi:hypothetical protein
MEEHCSLTIQSWTFPGVLNYVVPYEKASKVLSCAPGINSERPTCSFRERESEREGRERGGGGGEREREKREREKRNREKATEKGMRKILSQGQWDKQWYHRKDLVIMIRVLVTIHNKVIALPNGNGYG